MSEADAKRAAIHNHQPLPDAPKPTKTYEIVAENSDKVEKIQGQSEDDIISPRVLNMCLQVHPSVKESDRATAQNMIAEIESMGNLSMADWEYIQGHGYYKSIKNMAKEAIKNMLVSDGEGSEEKKEDAKPAPTTA